MKKIFFVIVLFLAVLWLGKKPQTEEPQSQKVEVQTNITEQNKTIKKDVLDFAKNIYRNDFLLPKITHQIDKIRTLEFYLHNVRIEGSDIKLIEEAEGFKVVSGMVLNNIKTWPESFPQYSEPQLEKVFPNGTEFHFINESWIPTGSQTLQACVNYSVDINEKKEIWCVDPASYDVVKKTTRLRH